MSSYKQNWLGKEGLTYIGNGEWVDPQVEYDGFIASYWDIVENLDVPEDTDLTNYADDIVYEVLEYGEMTAEKFCKILQEELAKKDLSLEDLVEEIGKYDFAKILKKFPLYQEEAYEEIAKLLQKVDIVS